MRASLPTDRIGVHAAPVADVAASEIPASVFKFLRTTPRRALEFIGVLGSVALTKSNVEPDSPCGRR